LSVGAAALCLILGAKTVRLETTHFTLRWTHSIEKTLWEEDYVLRDGRLALTEARIAGTGAGMEPPAGAVLREGMWHYVPALPPLPELRLSLSPYTADYRLCWAGSCRTLGKILDAPRATTAAVILRPCAPGDSHQEPR
jgi:hypothetical protein